MVDNSWWYWLYKPLPTIISHDEPLWTIINYYLLLSSVINYQRVASGDFDSVLLNMAIFHRFSWENSPTFDWAMASRAILQGMAMARRHQIPKRTQNNKFSDEILANFTTKSPNYIHISLGYSQFPNFPLYHPKSLCFGKNNYYMSALFFAAVWTDLDGPLDYLTT